MFAARVFAVPHGTGIIGQAGPDLIGKLGEALQEPGPEGVVQPQHVIQYQHLTIHGGPGTNAYGWNGKRS
jgi:hypothetical protein